MSGPRIVIVGAGVGGLAFAIALRQKLPGFNNFVIYEKSNDVGGTWRDNTYPGCSSDIPVHFYSLSTDLNPDWNYSHGTQAEFFQYLRGVARKYDLYSHIVLNTQVTSATWDPEKSKYIITTMPAPKSDNSRNREQANWDGKGEIDEAEILISALGPLEVVRYPDILGMGDFKGNLFHSGNWDHSVNLKGKKVAVVGNATSATQIIPEISKDSSIDVTNFCRTPNWFFPGALRPYSSLQKLMFRYVPFYMKFHRFYLFIMCEMLYLFVFSNHWRRQSVQERLAEYIKKAAPKEYHDRLTPTYTPGCKRLIFDRSKYLKSLHRPNVRLNWDGIDAITKTGVLTKTDESIPFDVIIFATGYVADSYPLHVKGLNETVKDYYDRKGGPMAYMGSAIPGFPNFFFVGGPNTGIGHTSFIFIEENHVHYILKLIEAVIKGDITTVEVTNGATERYQERIESRLQQSVFVDCQSWYRTKDTGRVGAIFPGSAMMFWWWFRKVNWEDYELVGKKRKAWRRQLRWRRRRDDLVNTAILGSLFFFLFTLTRSGIRLYEWVRSIFT
ncbi:FAD/NAD(P)-binding domain-containing protein [Marasmius fiardii PR-910]|nr:FAD/NAD(P)-binding domain-containing protein [Marasmius fiardii PR-910]